MKKVMSFAIVLMLAFSCVFTAFAQTDDTATPDEAKKVTELKITKLPDKLTYTSEDVIEPDIDLSKIADENATEESLIKYFSQFNLELKLDLTGMEIEAVYSDGTTEKVDAKDCKAELADPFNYGEVIKALIEYEKNMPEFTEDMTEDEFYELLEKALKVLVDMIYREYTVNVSYQDAQTNYKIMLEYLADPFNPDLPDDNDRYEVVSVKAPEKVNYTKADIVDLADYDYDDEPIYGFTPDYKGMEVVVKDIVTGKTYTIKFDGTEDIYVDELKRGQGIATRVIGLAEDKIKFHRGYTSICLEASPDNKAALALYHKLGYITLGMITVRKEIYKNDKKNETELFGLTYKY